jgi:hypothetical protein
VFGDTQTTNVGTLTNGARSIELLGRLNRSRATVVAR